MGKCKLNQSEISFHTHQMGKINWSGTTGLGKIPIARSSKGLPVGIPADILGRTILQLEN